MSETSELNNNNLNFTTDGSTVAVNLSVNNDVLTLSRLEHNHNTLVTDEIDLKDLVEQVVNDCQYFATSKNVSIHLKAEVNCPLLADCKLLASAISNVVNNAVKYSPNDQVVTLELAQQKEQIILSVSDHGPGVPEETIEKLFTPFFRVADGRERSSGGTGLGLAIAKQAITFHQGKIEVQNQATSGLKVIITLPTLLTQNKSNANTLS